MKKFEVIITMIIGLAEDTHYHKLQLEGNDEFDVFQQIKDCNWFHYERTLTTIEKGVRNTTTYHEFIQVNNISDITIVEIKEKGVNC